MSNSPSTYQAVGVRPHTKEQIDQFAARWRMTRTEAVEFAFEQVERLDREELIRRIERQPRATQLHPKPAA